MNRFCLRFYIFLIVSITYKTCFSQGTILLSEPFESRVLDQQIKYSVYLPENYPVDSLYPSLYLLHGLGGNEKSWIKRLELTHIVDSLINNNSIPPIIVIMPDGRNSYYINSYDMEFPYEDFFITEFMPYVDSNFSIHYNPKYISIAGLSMGGFGATILPVIYPDRFGTSINLSGAVRTDSEFIEVQPYKYHKYFAPIYGDSLFGDSRITEHWQANSPFHIIDSAYSDTLKNINWYISCGMQDFLFPSNKAMHELFLNYHIPHEFHMRPGNHSHAYWRKSFIRSMVYWGEILKKLEK